MKRFASFLLSLLMLAALAVPALADEESEELSLESDTPIQATTTDDEEKTDPVPTDTPAADDADDDIADPDSLTPDEPNTTDTTTDTDTTTSSDTPTDTDTELRPWTEDTFTDLTQEWYKPYVKFCYQTGLMNGTGESTFSPNLYGTRAQVVTVLYRLANEPDVAVVTSFSDVDSDQYYSQAVAWAEQVGITTGYEDGTFRPNRYVTRQEFLTFLYRFADLNADQWDTSQEIDAFADSASVQAYARAAENWSVATELQTGYEENGQFLLKPTSKVRRSEIATFLARYASE